MQSEAGDFSNELCFESVSDSEVDSVHEFVITVLVIRPPDARGVIKKSRWKELRRNLHSIVAADGRDWRDSCRLLSSAEEC